MPDEVQRLRHRLFSALEFLGPQKVLLPGFAVAFATTSATVSSSPSSPVDGIWPAPSSLLPLIRRWAPGRSRFRGQGSRSKLTSGGDDVRIDHSETRGFRIPVTRDGLQQRNKSKLLSSPDGVARKPRFTYF